MANPPDTLSTWPVNMRACAEPKLRDSRRDIDGFRTLPQWDVAFDVVDLAFSKTNVLLAQALVTDVVGVWNDEPRANRIRADAIAALLLGDRAHKCHHARFHRPIVTYAELPKPASLEIDAMAPLRRSTIEPSTTRCPGDYLDLLGQPHIHYASSPYARSPIDKF